MSMNSENLTRAALEPAKRYINLLSERKRVNAELNRLESEIRKEVNSIGRALAPDDARNGEVFHFWIRNPNDSGETLLAVTQVGKPDGCLPVFSAEIRWTNY